ncbi:MAG: GC-type dockerin domain-anchored protein [Phycisphaerales bacterium]
MMRIRLGVTVVLAAGLPLAAQPCTPGWDTTIGTVGIAGGYAGPARLWNDGNGERLYIGGSFGSAGGSGANAFLTRWNRATNTFSPVGGGLSGGFTNGFLTAILPFTPSGGGGERLVVAGFFDNAGGVPQTASLAMWNGSAWQAMGTTWTGNTRGSIWSMATWNGRLYVGGGVVNTQQPPAPPGMGYPIGGAPWAGLASWDGQEWESHIASITGFSPYVGALAVFNDGSGEALYAAGRFTGINGVTGTGLIARWNGTAWSSLASGLTSTSSTTGLEAMTIFDDGTGPALYVAGGTFFGSGLPVCNVAKWNGNTWTSLGGQLGTGRLTSIAAFDDGGGTKIYIGGTAMVPINQFARWENGQWASVDGGFTGSAIPPSNFPSVFGLAVAANRLVVAGNFVAAGGMTANGLVERTSCPTACYPNCDGSTTPPALNIADFICFNNQYAAGNSYANCDASTTPPVLNVADFICYLNAYAAGCS